MDEYQEQNIPKIARDALSVDGELIATAMEEEIPAWVDEGELSERDHEELKAIASILRGLGSTIHPLDWTVQKLATSDIVKKVCGKKFNRRQIANRTLIWLAESAAAQLHDMIEKE